MSFLDQFSSPEPGYDASNSSEMDDFFSASDNTVTVSNAQKIATVFSCVNIKANALAVIPLKTYKRTENGKEEDYRNPLYELLRYAPNQSLTASLYKKIISQDIDLRGNHYSQVVRNGLGKAIALYPLYADKMLVTVEKNGRKRFKYDNKSIPANKVLHLYDIPDSTGYQGLSRIEYAKNELEFTKNASMYGNQLFKNGARPSGVFENPGELGDESFKRLKKQLDEKYIGLMNAGKSMLLESGLVYKPLAMKNSDSEWLESRKFNREQVAAIFGVPVAMLNDPSNTSFGNLEQKYLEFYSGTILPLTTIVEEQIWLDLVPANEKQKTVVKFKYNAMLRVDTENKTKYYKMRHETASITPNEIRGYEDENGYREGDEHYVMTNMTTVKNLNKGGKSNE